MHEMLATFAGRSGRDHMLQRTGVFVQALAGQGTSSNVRRNGALFRYRFDAGLPVRAGLGVRPPAARRAAVACPRVDTELLGHQLCLGDRDRRLERDATAAAGCRYQPAFP